MNTYSDIDGERYTTPQIESRIKKAALLKLEEQRNDHGYNFCVKCKRNDCKPIDVSHTVSRKEAKESGRVSILWALENLELLGRPCHQEKDGLGLF